MSPMLFTIYLLPLTTLLKKSGLGFTIHNVTISHLLYMEDLKLCAKSNKDMLALTKIVKTFSKDICMQFGLDKCATVTINRGQVVRGDGLKLPPDEVVNPLPLEENYKYLSILEHGSINNIDVKKEATMEYKKRLCQFLKSKLSGSNLLQAINIYAIPVMSYTADTVDWTLDEMRQLDRMTRKQLTIHGAFHPKADMQYIPRRKGGRGLKSIEDFMFKEWCALSEYLKHSTTPALKLLSKKGIRKNQTDREDHLMKWEAKALHEKWAKLLKIVDVDWLRTAHLKPPTEVLIIAAQDQALHTNWLGHYVLKTGETTDKYRRCKRYADTVMHIVSGCPMLAQGVCCERHNQVASALHWDLISVASTNCPEDWWENKPEPITENERVRILWDFTLRLDRLVEARKPDIVFMDKTNRKAKIIDIACPIDYNIREIEQEKIVKYQDLEIEKLWKVRVEVIPVVIGALGVVKNKHEDYVKKIDESILLEDLQKAALLGTARIVRNVLQLPN
uniref:Reverse transcriptase domain-containing protein n=1 Tax=Latimeria chalumnae TaxID=7897 RepID=H2ZXX1_LATCH